MPQDSYAAFRIAQVLELAQVSRSLSATPLHLLLSLPLLTSMPAPGSQHVVRLMQHALHIKPAIASACLSPFTSSSRLHPQYARHVAKSGSHALILGGDLNTKPDYLEAELLRCVSFDVLFDLCVRPCNPARTKHALFPRASKPSAQPQPHSAPTTHVQAIAARAVRQLGQPAPG